MNQQKANYSKNLRILLFAVIAVCFTSVVVGVKVAESLDPISREVEARRVADGIATFKDLSKDYKFYKAYDSFWGAKSVYLESTSKDLYIYMIKSWNFNPFLNEAKYLHEIARVGLPGITSNFAKAYESDGKMNVDGTGLISIANHKFHYQSGVSKVPLCMGYPKTVFVACSINRNTYYLIFISHSPHNPDGPSKVLNWNAINSFLSKIEKFN